MVDWVERGVEKMISNDPQKKNKQKETFNEDYIQAQMKESGLTHTEVKEILETTLYEGTPDFTDDGKEFNRSLLSELSHSWNVFMKSTDNAVSMRARKLYHELYEHLNKELNKKKSDFVDDGFSKQTKRSKDKFLIEFINAVEELRNSVHDSEVNKRARKLVQELQKFITDSDFTDDGRRMNNALLQELAELFEAWGQDADPAVNRRVEKMFGEIKQYLMKELAKAGKKSDFTDDANTPVANKLYRAMDQIMYVIDRQMTRLENELVKMSDRERDRLYDHPFLREFKADILP